MALNTDIQQKVYDLLSRASNLSFVSAEQEGGGRLVLTPGQRVTAEVVAALPNNLAQVRVGTSQYKLELPMAVKAGQNLEMTFVSSDPRSTFAIARQGVPAPPVALSDASRLLALLADSEQAINPQTRLSLQSVSEMLRRSSSEAGVLANLMDEALVYTAPRNGAAVSSGTGSAPLRQQQLSPEQARLAQFESNASQILQNIARNARSILVEAANAPLTPLPLLPGEEVDAAVLGTLPGGRTFVQVAGTPLELNMPRRVTEGDILRLTLISAQPKPLFALPRALPEQGQGVLSEAGRWLGVLEHTEGGVSNQQMFVLERLNTVLKSLPPDSPAFTVIKDEAITYDAMMRSPRKPGGQSVLDATATITPEQAALRSGNNIVLSEDMARLLQALIKGNRLALLEALNLQSAPTGFLPGQQIRAEVLATLGGGSFLVQVGRQTFEFSMPKGTQRGDRFSLFFISEAPPTFLMTRFGSPGDSRVSETGRWLSGFIGSAAEGANARETIGLLQALLSGPPLDAAEVAGKLQQGLRESGLFYESHLSRWFRGDYQLEDLLREPQGRLSAMRYQLQQSLQGQGGDEKSMTGARSLSLEMMEAAFNKAGKIADLDSVLDRRGVAIVREQLEGLQAGQVNYRGELFPGQNLEWLVSEREAHRNKKGERERSWDTSLALDFPGLGGIVARLKLDGNQVRIDIQASREESVELLDSERARLLEQLQGAGLEPAEIRIGNEENRSR
jgi:hypothetical protein